MFIVRHGGCKCVCVCVCVTVCAYVCVCVCDQAGKNKPNGHKGLDDYFQIYWITTNNLFRPLK